MYKPLTALKKDFDAVFSQFIRLSHADAEGNCFCFTCNKQFHWKKLQNGHFVTRNSSSARYDEGNCRPQCWGCNGYGQGRVLDFEEHLVKEIGREKVEALKASRHVTVKRTPMWFEEQIGIYKAKVKELENGL